jgi:predicted transposase YdaD
MLMTEWKLEDALVVEREEGREEGKGETIKNLLDFGMEAEQISRALKIPLDAVLRYVN